MPEVKTKYLDGSVVLALVGLLILIIASGIIYAIYFGHLNNFQVSTSSVTFDFVFWLKIAGGVAGLLVVILIIYLIVRRYRRRRSRAAEDVGEEVGEDDDEIVEEKFISPKRVIQNRVYLLFSLVCFLLTLVFSVISQNALDTAKDYVDQSAKSLKFQQALGSLWALFIVFAFVFLFMSLMRRSKSKHPKINVGTWIGSILLMGYTIVYIAYIVLKLR